MTITLDLNQEQIHFLLNMHESCFTSGITQRHDMNELLQCCRLEATHWVNHRDEDGCVEGFEYQNLLMMPVYLQLLDHYEGSEAPAIICDPGHSPSRIQHLFDRAKLEIARRMGQEASLVPC